MSDTAPAPSPRAGSTLRNLLLAGGAGVVALVIAEGVLRLMLPAPPRWTIPQESYLFDDEIAHRLSPNQKSYTHDKPVETNSQGIRDREYEESPAPGVTRILAIGDSQTFGNGLALSDTWPKQLERQLMEHDGEAGWEVLNCGIPGTDTWQHEIVLQRLVRAYHPAVVVVAVYPNDVSRPFHPDPRQALPTGTAAKRLAYMFKESTVCMIGLQGFKGLRQKLSPTGEAIREHAILTGGDDPLVAEGWVQVERSLQGMKKECEANSERLVVLVIPRRDEVAGIEKSRAFNERVRSIADRNGIPWVDPIDALEEEYRRSGQAMFLAWDGHNTGIANGIIARELARRLGTGAFDRG